ncbi:MAG TPA: thioredoxin-disulfide reductase [Candidatus Bipolaricaulota bacterium]|nr:thioredoxin-disulfide reductase [Candidatus Bipolaricaulota bacterium]
MENEQYDVIIIGAGAAGLTAAIYAGRRELKTLVLTKDIGGQAAITDEIENWPGEMSILGPALMEKIKNQAEKWGAKIEFDEVSKIEKTGEFFTVKTGRGEFLGTAVILCFGLSHRRLGIPGEKEFVGKGVSFCATCDGPLFRNKTVAIAGGGNSALDAAEYLARLAEKVYIIIRKDSFSERAETVAADTIAELEKQGKIEMRWNTDVKEIKGDKTVKSIMLENTKSGQVEELPINGIFVEVGMIPQTKAIEGLVDLDERGQIVIDQACQTSAPGIFAAGDVTCSPYKQLVTSAGEGAKAALSAYAYLRKAKGGHEGSLRDYKMKKK